MEEPAVAEKPADTKAKPAAGKNKKKKPLPSFLGDDDDDGASPAPAAAAETPPAADAAAAAAAAATAAVATEAGAAPGADEALRLSIQSMSAETVELKLTVEPEAAAVAAVDPAAKEVS